MEKKELVTTSHVESTTHTSKTASEWDSIRERWLGLHRSVQIAIGLAVVVLLALTLGASIGGIALIAVALMCPLMMIGMMFGMHGLHGHMRHSSSDGQAASAAVSHDDHALQVLRERYARGELSKEQLDQMIRDLS